MADAGHIETEKLLKHMEKEIDAVYKQAYREARETADSFMKQFRAMDMKKRQEVKDGELDKSEYERWRRTQVFQGNRYHQMADTLAADMTHSKEIAMSVVNGYTPEVYAINHNYGTYEVEKGAKINTQYTLYDRQTVERIMRDNPDLIPKPKVNIPKDELWNKKHINSAVMQGIMQGESIDKISQRLAATVTDMSHNSAIRSARTMTTSAENGGRVDSYKRAEKMGIEMVQVWMATLDGRTRHEHRQLDGQKRKVGEPFEVDGMKIDFPGDPKAEPQLVYNCRCTLIGEVKGVDYNLSDVTERDNKLGDMTYEQWKEEKKKPEKEQPKPEPKKQEPAVIEVPASKEITTKEEAYNYLGTIFASTEKNVSNLNQQLVIENVNQLKKLNDKFGAITSNNVGYVSGTKIKAIAQTSQRLQREECNLTMSSKYYKDRKTLLAVEKQMQESFYSMPVSDDFLNVASITHEYGHILEAEITKKRMDKSFFEQYAKDHRATPLYVEERKQAATIWNEILAIAKEDNPDFKLKDELSKYGHTNHFEAFAETFMNSQCGAPNALGKAMIKWLEREWL